MLEPLRAGILAEVRRVLAPGGILVVLDYVRPEAPHAGFPFAMVNLVERLAGYRHHLNYRDFLLRGATGACMERHGMRVVETEERLFGTMVLVTAVPDAR
jgi:ubiquinone/menaquinone biosynthesis C-methylase UbiE